MLKQFFYTLRPFASRNFNIFLYQISRQNSALPPLPKKNSQKHQQLPTFQLLEIFEFRQMIFNAETNIRGFITSILEFSGLSPI